MWKAVVHWSAAVGIAISSWAYAQSADTVEAGHLVLDGQTEAALHLNSEVEMTIKGLEAQVTVTQHFQSTSSSWTHATYVYPLPEDSAVYAMKMVIGERVIVGEIQEKEQARKNFEQARAAGHKTTLLEQQRPNLFRQEIANLAPGERVEVQIRYTQKVIYDSGEFRLRLPMTLTPRYIPGATPGALQPDDRISAPANGWALPTDQVPDAHRITPSQRHAQPGELLNPVSLNVQLEPGVPLAKLGSATHQLDVQQQIADNRYLIRFAQGQVSMDRDFELSWTPEAQSAPVAAVFQDHWQGERYLQLLLMPPQEVDAAQVLPRELLLVVDTSGSMAGTSIVQARDSALLALAQLQPTDRFNVIFFDSTTRSVFDTAVEATPGNLALARAAINAMRAEGGTEMMAALERAFSHPANHQHLQQIVFVTDGSVGNETALLALIHKRLGEARLFTVAIGSAPNRFFMRRAAQFGRGSFTEIATSDQVRERMQILLNKLQKPVVANLQIEWPHAVEAYPSRLPDLYWGEPLLITAKLPGLQMGQEEDVIIRGESAGKPWSRKLILQAPGPDKNTEGVTLLARRFGREKITELESRSVQQDNESEARAAILPVALHYQLMSRFTSLIAIDQTPARNPEEPAQARQIANAMPAGSAMQAVGYPQTAAGIGWHLALGTFALIALIALRRAGVRHGG